MGHWQVPQVGGKNMLLGQYDAKIDKKNRLALPKKLREFLGNKLIITKGYENSLIIVSEEGWKALLEGTEGKPFIQSEARETQRFLLGGASFAELDDKGRFLLPSYLRSFGEIKEEVIFLGLSRYVELWDKKRWDEYSSGLEKNIDKISKKLITPDEEKVNE
ncbi:division/cell wall cluster transcriptional repressor MraZ [Candidatus Microgenomates bacterium]|nr:MAG: division/cell wall cluster transcriptional repressor MraZ [Candidatus Microgenomates bacterium]